jgi:hypothetical protein
MKLRCPRTGPRLCLRPVYVAYAPLNARSCEFRVLWVTLAARRPRPECRESGMSARRRTRPRARRGVLGVGVAFWVRDATNARRTVLTNCVLRL